MNRVLEALIAVLALLAATPLLAAIAIAVLLSLGRPIIFTQERTGLHGSRFTLYKFRTMTEARDESGTLLEDHLRVTRVGRFLRHTSLDELPELWNVVVGDMALVGPRPLLPEYLHLYTPRQSRRHEVRPGITGIAQISGRNRLAWEDRLELDVWYVDHKTVRLDLVILVRTLTMLVRGKGDGAHHSQRFRG